MKDNYNRQSRFGGHFYLEHILETDLEKDRLYRIGKIQDPRVEGSDVVCTAPLIRQKYMEEDSRFYTDDKEEGTVFIRFRVYNAALIRIQITPRDAGFNDDTPVMSMDRGLSPISVELQQEESEWVIFEEGETRIRLRDEHLAPELWPDEETYVKFQNRDWFFTEYFDALSAMLFIPENGPVTIGVSFVIDEGEHFCGTGERFDRIDLFGREIDLVNENGHGCNSPRTYKNIPLLLSSRPYGLFAHSHAKMRLDIGRFSSRSLQWFVEDDNLDLFVIGGGSFQKIIQNYQRLTGFPAMPPLWSFGTWMSRCTYKSDEQASGIAKRLREEHYPADVIHLDTGWFNQEWKCDWTFSRERFPDPEDFFKRMRNKGFRVSLWEYPYVNPDLEISKEATEKGYVGKRTTPETMVEWGDTIDFTNAGAVKWYKGMLKRLLQMGAAAFKTDFGENIDENAVYQNIDAQKYRNLFSLLYQKATWEITEEVTGEPFNWARSGWAGSQRYPLHWSADCSSTFDGVAHSLYGGLHIGLSGFAFWSHDIGGFYAIGDFMNMKPAEDLYLRWTQHGVLSSHMRYHGMTPREPWEYPGVADMVREWLRFRYALLPYILSESKKSCSSGLPVLRALVFEWTDDPAVWTVSDQYMFGDAIMVCPVFNESGTRDVYLPEGRWVDFWSGMVQTGPTHMQNVRSPLSRIPLYVRYGKTIEFAEPVQCTDELEDAPRFQIRFDRNYSGFEASKLGEFIGI